MKPIFTLLILITSGFCSAQPSQKELIKHNEKVEKSKSKKSIEISLDTLFNAGEPYCVYIEGRKMLGNIMDITVISTSGAEAMWCKLVTAEELNRSDFTTAYEITFVQSGNKALYMLTLGNSFPKEIVKNDLFLNGQFNANAEAKFISFNPYKTGISTQQVPQSQTNTGPVLVDRNRNQLIQIFGNEIKQDFKVIGKIEEKTQAKGGAIKKIISFSLPDGTLVAIAEGDNMGTHWHLVTAKDNKQHHVDSSFGNDKKDLASFLVKYLYL